MSNKIGTYKVGLLVYTLIKFDSMFSKGILVYYVWFGGAIRKLYLV